MQALSDDLLRGAQAAADYISPSDGPRVSRAAVYRMAESGKLPVIRLGPKGSQIWFRKSDLEAAFTAGMIAA